MGQINLARVDERLIHGQVMITLSQRSGVNSIFVVDDVVAMDKFMREIYMSAGSRTGQKTIVTTMDRMKSYWHDYNLKDYNCILLTKSVKSMYELVKDGVEIKELNIGGVAEKDSSKDIRVTKAVYINQEDAEMLKEMHQKYGVENIYFQQTPSSEKHSLKEVLGKFNIKL